MKKILLILLITAFALKIQAQNTEMATPANDDKIYTADIDVLPEFKGGMDRFYSRLQRIPYTIEDRMNLCQGRVMVMMVIEKDGSLSNLRVIHGFSQKQDKEIIRVVKGLRQWKPGMHKGQPVRVLYAVPINFKIIESS